MINYNKYCRSNSIYFQKITVKIIGVYSIDSLLKHQILRNTFPIYWRIFQWFSLLERKNSSCNINRNCSRNTFGSMCFLCRTYCRNNSFGKSFASVTNTHCFSFVTLTLHFIAETHGNEVCWFYSVLRIPAQLFL